MTNHAPAAASHLLTDALLARLREQDDTAAQCEELAHSCTDYMPEWCIAGYLLPAAKRHAQFEDVDRMNQMLSAAWAHAGTNPRAQLRVIAGSGIALAWLGQLARAYVLISTANMLIAPFALAGAPGYNSLWMHTTRELGFVLQQLPGRPAELRRLQAALAAKP